MPEKTIVLANLQVPWDHTCPECHSKNIKEIKSWKLGAKTKVHRYECDKGHHFRTYEKL